MDYSCIEYYQKSYENETDPILKENALNTILETKAIKFLYFLFEDRIIIRISLKVLNRF